MVRPEISAADASEYEPRVLRHRISVADGMENDPATGGRRECLVPRCISGTNNPKRCLPADNRRMDPAARRSVIMLAVIIGAMAIFAVIYLLSGGAAPDPSPVP
jgi:hypothetical protein